MKYSNTHERDLQQILLCMVRSLRRNLWPSNMTMYDLQEYVLQAKCTCVTYTDTHVTIIGLILDSLKRNQTHTVPVYCHDSVASVRIHKSCHDFNINLYMTLVIRSLKAMFFRLILSYGGRQRKAVLLTEILFKKTDMKSCLTAVWKYQKNTFHGDNV